MKKVITLLSLVTVVSTSSAQQKKAVPTFFGVAIQGKFVGDGPRKPYVPPPTYTPDQKIESEQDKALAPCAKSNSTAAACLMKVAKENQTPEMLYAIIDALDDGWIKKPWGLEVLNGIFPLLNSENPAIRGQYIWWHALDKKRLGEESDSILAKLPQGKIVYQIKSQVVAPGIVQVGSTFENEGSKGNKSEISELGTGNIVHIPGAKDSSSYILTAAHLIGGKKPIVLLKGKSYAIKGYLANNDLDVALIEVDKIDGPSAMTYERNKNRLVVNFDLEQAYYRETIPWANMSGGSVADFLKDRTALSIVLVMNPWSEEGIEYSSGEFRSEDASFSRMGFSYNQQYIRTRTKVTGGTSGALAFKKASNLVEGLVTQSNYYFGETFLLRTPSLINTIDQYLSGKRGSSNSTVWKMKNALAYRQYADGWSEANFSDRKVGKGIVGDPGKGVVGDPGKGVVGDPGKNKKFSPWSAKNPQQLFDFYGLEPGMKLNGKSIIGIYAHAFAPSSMPAKLFLYADEHAVQFMRKYANQYEFWPVENGTDLLNFTHRRLGLAYAQTIYTIPTGGAPTDMQEELYSSKIRGGGFSTGSQSLEIREDEIRLRMKTYSAKQISEKDPTTDDELEIILNSQGIPKGSNQKQFLPIIETKGLRSGQKYYVDLRRLIFQDLSQINLPTWTSDQNIWKSEMKRQLETFAVKARNANSGLEIGFTFVPQP